MSTLRVKKADATVLKAFIKVLAKHYDVTVEIRKPRLHLTPEVSVTGTGERGFLEDMTTFCSQLGWKMEFLRELSE